MDKQKTLTKKSHRTLRSVSFGIMCFLTLFCIAAAIWNGIFSNPQKFSLCIIYIIGLIFLTVLSGYLLARTDEIAGPKRYYALFLINTYTATFFSVLSMSMYNIPGHARQITFFGSVCYFFTMLIYLTLWLYQKHFLEESPVTRAVTVLIIITLVIYTSALIVNLFRPVIFMITEEGVFYSGVTDYFSVISGLFCLMLLSIATFSSKLGLSRKFSFLCCIFTPTLFGILSMNQEILSWGIYIWGIMSITLVLPLCLIFFNAHDELEKDVVMKEKEQTHLRISAMISQMQPHFLYNSLAIIAALCEEDPKLAARATNAFSDYLRENMDFADKSNPISFSEELKHIETYVWLEMLRFPNRLNMEYDIKCTSFPIPALSVQPMVENAIKHGICKNKSGGTVRLCSFETDQFYCVKVSDDGTGFDVQKKTDDNRQHLGIKNTRYRIREMLGGSLDIKSLPGEGTTVTIKIPKDRVSNM